MRANRTRRSAWWMVVLCCSISVTCRADDDPVPPPVKSIPIVTVSGGLGSTMGGWGLQGEYYFCRGRVTAFGAVGYFPGSTENEIFHVPGAVTFALGGRAYTHGRTHHAFVELSVTPITRKGTGASDGTILESSTLYGPGIAVGYHHVSGGGLVFLISGGIGYASGSGTSGIFTIGIGQMWRR